MPGQPTHFTHATELEKTVSWPAVTLGLSALGIGCLLLGTYVVGPLVRQRVQPAPLPAVPAAYAPAPAPVTPPPVATIPRGQNAVQVTEHTDDPPEPPKPEKAPDSITPVITPAAPAPTPPAVDPPEATPATTPEPAATPSASTPPSPASERPAAPAPISLAPPPPASVGEPAATPPARYFRVQVGRFNGRSDAEALKVDLGKAGYNPTIVKVFRDGRDEYRVQVNTFRLRENAMKMMEELKQKQFAPYLAEDNP